MSSKPQLSALAKSTNRRKYQATGAEGMLVATYVYDEREATYEWIVRGCGLYLVLDSEGECHVYYREE